MFRDLRQAVKDFIDDDCPTLAAALAYYTVFSLPPLLFTIIVIAGFVVGRETVQAAIQQQAQSIIGGGASGQVGTMVSGAGQTSGPGLVGLVLSIAAVVLGATGAFAQLQAALNRAWEVRSASGGIRAFLMKRLVSFAMVIGMAVLVLASLVLNAWVSSAGNLLGAPRWVMAGLSFAVSFLVLFALFAAIFRYLPDAEVDWSDVRTGALVTAALFEAGHFLLGMYLGRSGTASMYGAAGSLALILVFIYYSSMLVLYGAEFTQVWAKSHGKTIQPSRGAERLPQAA